MGTNKFIHKIAYRSLTKNLSISRNYSLFFKYLFNSIKNWQPFLILISFSWNKRILLSFNYVLKISLGFLLFDFIIRSIFYSLNCLSTNDCQYVGPKKKKNYRVGIMIMVIIQKKRNNLSNLKSRYNRFVFYIHTFFHKRSIFLNLSWKFSGV
jgi:hypothetical protein